MTALSHRCVAGVSLAALFLLTACQTTPETQAKKESLEDAAQATIARFEREDPGVRDVLRRAYGYAIFPDVGKGGVIVGGAYGRGTVYEQGKMAGYADLTQATIGAQLGGETFAELIAFETQSAMDRFKNNQLAFSANVSAVAIKAGKASSAKYDNGVVVFTEPNGGAFLEASVGGQKLTFVPLSNARDTRPHESIETKTEVKEKM